MSGRKPGLTVCPGCKLYPELVKEKMDGLQLNKKPICGLCRTGSKNDSILEFGGSFVQMWLHTVCTNDTFRTCTHARTE